MPRLTPQHYRILVRIFKEAGFSISREEGDHIIMNKPGIDRCLVIPKYKEVGVDIIKANLPEFSLNFIHYTLIRAED